jgi:hypothetical protein
MVGLVEAYNGGQPLSDNQMMTLNIIGVSGIEIDSWPEVLINSSLEITISNSQIGFYLNGTSLNDDKICAKGLVDEKAGNLTLFNKFQTITFAYANNYQSNAPSCRFIFTNADMQVLTLWHHIDTILVKNIWGFKSLNETTTINSKIIELDIAGYGYSLDTSVLHL